MNLFVPSSLIYDADFDDNLDRPLEDLNIKDQTMLNVEDDAQDFKLLVSIVHSEDFNPESEKQFDLVGGAPAPSAIPVTEPSVEQEKKVQEDAPESSSSSSSKRKFEEIEDDDLVIIEPSKASTNNGNGHAAEARGAAEDPKGKKKQKTSN